MDGYAPVDHQPALGDSWTLVGVPLSVPYRQALNGEAIRILTGAPRPRELGAPPGIDCPQGTLLHLNKDASPTHGSEPRRGMREGARLLATGERLGVADIGRASTAVSHTSGFIDVLDHVLISGDGCSRQERSDGAIWESNSLLSGIPSNSATQRWTADWSLINPSNSEQRFWIWLQAAM